LEQAAIGIRKDNDLFCEDIKKLSIDNDSTRRKTDDLDKYHQKLKT
jgi:chromosome segregation ATPase